MPRILIVDDEENQRRTLSIGLKLDGFEVFLTVDKNLPKQQKLAAYAIAVVCCVVPPMTLMISGSWCRR